MAAPASLPRARGRWREAPDEVPHRSRPRRRGRRPRRPGAACRLHTHTAGRIRTSLRPHTVLPPAGEAVAKRLMRETLRLSHTLPSFRTALVPAVGVGVLDDQARPTSFTHTTRADPHLASSLHCASPSGGSSDCRQTPSLSWLRGAKRSRRILKSSTFS